MSHSGRHGLDTDTPCLWGVWGTVAVAVLAVAGRWWQAWGGPLPGCLFYLLTGKPCMTCGGTRLLLALGRGEGWEAWRWNPLMFAGVVGLAAWGVMGLLSRLTRWPGEPRLRAWVWGRRRWWIALLVAAALTNWAYLWQHLPRQQESGGCWVGGGSFLVPWSPLPCFQRNRSCPRANTHGDENGVSGPLAKSMG